MYVFLCISSLDSNKHYYNQGTELLKHHRTLCASLYILSSNPGLKTQFNKEKYRREHKLKMKWIQKDSVTQVKNSEGSVKSYK